MRLRSSAMREAGEIPPRFTCQGEDLSPPLGWEGEPEGTRSFVLIVDDPDAPDPDRPRLTWVHWILYNIPATVHALDEGAGNRPPAAGEHALTHADALGYHGPCPPIGRHRYYFRLFALDCLLPSLGPTARRPEVEQAMRGHVLASAEVMGTYRKA